MGVFSWNKMRVLSLCANRGDPRQQFTVFLLKKRCYSHKIHIFVLVSVFITWLSFPFISLRPVESTFLEMQKISFSLSISGSLAMLPFPWAAVTSSAHALKAREARAFWLAGFEYFLILRQCRATVSASSMQSHHGIYSGLGLSGGRGQRESLQGEFVYASLCWGRTGQTGSGATAASSHSWDVPASQLNMKATFGFLA